MSRTVLEVSNLSVIFKMYGKGLEQKNLEVIHDLSLDIKEGEIMAVVGSSGSGKSLLAHAILGILPGNASTTGQIRYQGELLTEKEKKRLRGNGIAFIPQSVEYLDPLMRVDRQVMGVRGSREQQQAAFKRCHLDPSDGKKYPFQLSGGMARRVLISAATLEKAGLIVADEPTPGLNVEMAMETLQHFRKLADSGCGVLLITHDVDLALQVADRISVFYAGTTVEITSAEDFRQGGPALRHPYSRAFHSALPQNEFKPIPGFQPYAGELPTGCLFAPRCPERTGACRGQVPMRELRGGKVRCINAT